MSHVVQITTQIKSEAAVQAACRRLRLPSAVHETVRLYADTAAGLAVRLPGWRYPVVCDLATGSLKYDNFEGVWGDRQQLDTFLQSYAVERARIQARASGHTVSEARLDDGSIRLTVHVGGAR